ncbi:MAG: efflux RND transporter permease subunit [Planctomycetes bacterium]|nr:efflux RND transporter permease subunit [Planctomycetota bacterium]
MTGPAAAPPAELLQPDDFSVWIRVTIFRPITVLMLFVAFLATGLMAFPRIRTELLPPGLESGVCGVHIPVREGTPREVMEQIAKPTEDLLRTLPGLKSVTSSSGANRCHIQLEFNPEYDMSVLVAETRDRLDRARSSWPEGVDRYFIWRRRESDLPVYIASVGIEIDKGHEEKVDLDYVFEEVIRKRLEAVSGVASVNIWGNLEKRVEISLDKNKVDAHGINVYQLVQRLAGDNQIVNAGFVRDGDRELMIRVDSRFRDFQEVLDYRVDPRFTIRDFAEVRFATPTRDRLSRVNGHLSRVIVIHQEATANAVKVCQRLESVLEDLKKTLGRSIPGAGRIESHAWLNQGEMITISVRSLAENGLFGGICAIVVLYLFLRRMALTLLVTLAIPFSLLITVVWIFFSGGSFNLLTLMGLSLGIGMLVDNSIVVVENILRYRERGLSPRLAAIEGVREVGLAVSLATLTTLVVFLPIFFMSDERFKVMTRTMGMPLCVSVLASLLVALVFIPQGAIYLQDPLHLRNGQRKGASDERFSPLNRGSARILSWCLRHRFTAAVFAFLFLGSAGVAARFLPKRDADLGGPGGIEIRLELGGNFTLSEANDTFARVEKAVREAGREFSVESITSWFSAGGGDLRVFFAPGKRVDEQQFFSAIRPALPRLPGVKYHLGYESFSRDEGRQRIRIFLTSMDYDRLEEAEEVIYAALENNPLFPGLGEIARWSDETPEEIRIKVDRRAAQQLGVDTAMVSRMVAWALRGAPLPDFWLGNREYPFWILHSDAQKESAEELSSILVPRAAGDPVRLETVARYHPARSSGDIHRRDGKLTAGLSVAVEGEVDVELRQRLEDYLKVLRLPEGCEVSLRPPQGGFEADLQNTSIALAMALGLVFFVMGILFESRLMPLSVLLSIPFAFFGSIWLLLVTGVSLDAVGLIGLLMLVGIVVNNAIVLVDYINRLRDRGLRRLDAVLRAVQVRFRPIWMTALTTIFGLFPLVLLKQKGEGIDYKPLAVVIIGGLGTSTFFTLFVVPLLYTFLDDTRRLASLLGGRGPAARGETSGRKERRGG